jgi:hypothetical protein
MPDYSNKDLDYFSNEISTKNLKTKNKEITLNNNLNISSNENSFMIVENNDESFMKTNHNKRKNLISEILNNSPKLNSDQSKIKKENLTVKIPNVFTLNNIKLNTLQKNSELNESVKKTKFNSFLKSTGLSISDKNNNNNISELKTNYFHKNENNTFLNEISDYKITNENFQKATRNILEGILKKRNKNEDHFHNIMTNSFKLFDKIKTNNKIKYPDTIYMNKDFTDLEERKKLKEKKLDRIFNKKMDYKVIMNENFKSLKLNLSKKKIEYDSNDVKKFEGLYRKFSNTIRNIDKNKF